MEGFALPEMVKVKALYFYYLAVAAFSLAKSSSP